MATKNDNEHRLVVVVVVPRSLQARAPERQFKSA